MNPFLQILGVDPGIKNPDGPKTGDNIIGVYGTVKDTESAIDFGSLLANIDILNADSETNHTFIKNITDNLNNNRLLNDKNALELLFGLRNNEIPINTGNAEKNEINLSADNNVKVFVPDSNVIKPLEPESEIQQQQSENRPIAIRAVPVNLLANRNTDINHNVVPTDKNDAAAYLAEQSNREHVNTLKSDSAAILFRTNIQNADKTNHPIGSDIFNQKLNLLNLRQIELTEKHINPVTDSEIGRGLPAEKVSAKADFEIPTLIRAFPVGTPIKNSAAVRITPHAGLPVSNTDELLNGGIINGPAAAEANTTGNDNLNNLSMNDPGTGKKPNEIFGKPTTGGFAKTLGGEMLTSSLNDITKIGNIPTKSKETTVRFIVPNKLPENGGLVNRTITIKMEPEHLGTIRLTLSSINQGLIGRMVVESAAAHTIVESNIDNLFSELSDKGIKLNAFSVSVGADSEGKKSTQDRKPFRMNNRGGGNKDKNRLEAISPAVAEAVSNRMYVNSNGVNWLA